MTKAIKLPRCKLVGTNGNVFDIIGRVGKSLRDAGRPELATEFTRKAMGCGSYDEVLQLCFQYVHVE